MFGRWKLGAQHSQTLSLRELAALAPFRHATPGELETLQRLAQPLAISPGLIDEQLPADQMVFLYRGSVQIQTRSGFVLTLKSDAQLAQYPIPEKRAIVSLFAPEPCTFIILPQTSGPSTGDAGQAVREAPALNPAEQQALAELIAYFKEDHCELPSLPDLALKIGKAVDDRQNNNADVARLIQLDPSLSARILSVVNSAAFGGFNKIGGIGQAISRLGRKRVRSLVYSCLLKDIFRAKSARLRRHMEALWAHSANVAALSFVLARQTPGIDPEQALLAGLVHDIGTVAVLGGINKWPILAAREEVLDYTVARLRGSVGELTIRHWRLDESLLDVVRDAEYWQRIGSAVPENPDVVILAQMHAMIGTPEQAGLPRIDEVPAFGKLAQGELSPRHSLAILDEAEADVKAVRAMISFS